MLKHPIDIPNTTPVSQAGDPAAALPEVLNLKEAAVLLRVRPATVYYMLENGQLRARRCGKEYRFRKADLLAWLAGEGDGKERA